ncbi:zinc-ribbon-domain-containing protein [Fennellomyces sp. T-0311]|nr:zinc-ribbon-domain-containing protein [Fennellomyces sp. T-0311]
MGCKHYQRKVKLEANCCKRIFPCRFCHDDVSDHNIVRHETKNMLCMECMTLQPAAKTCTKCGIESAKYFCDKCKLWDDDPKKSIYHCDDCGICRQGRGLDEDYFHCNKCNICMMMAMKDNHRCIERNLESDCPICGEYMFTSTTTVIFMPCGHCIHKLCYSAYIQTSYQCPTCLKSLGNMSEYFARLDRELVRQPMPSEYEKYVSHIFCNDCEKKSSAKYHFFYHKCTHCGGYNTTVLKTENTEEKAQEDDPKNAPLPPSSSAFPVSSSSTGDASNGSTDALGHSANSDNDQQMMHSHGSATAGNGAVSGQRNGSSSSAPPLPRTSTSLHDNRDNRDNS